MVISKYQHESAVKKIVKALPESMKKEEDVAKFIKELELAVGKHYCVGYMRYIEDGMYDFSSEPEQFATREEVDAYLKENEIDCYYDDDKEAWVDEDSEDSDKYCSEDEGWRVWSEE